MTKKCRIVHTFLKKLKIGLHYYKKWGAVIARHPILQTFYLQNIKAYYTHYCFCRYQDITYQDR